LFGKTVQKETIVERVVMTHNVLQSTTRFEIDSMAFYRAFTRAEEDGLAFLGFFHSHPAPATPSNVDLHFMGLWGDAVWLIFSLTEDRFAAFSMDKRRAVPLVLEVEGKD